MEIELLEIATMQKYIRQWIKQTLNLPPEQNLYQYLQKSEKQGHMFRILNELLGELGSQVICLLLSILIYEGDQRLKLVMSPVITEARVISQVREPVGLFITISLSWRAIIKGKLKRVYHWSFSAI